ncbi:MAG: AAA family ATPase [Candidatus Omnitrophica bacterium]|nr:AAA family ATPase [Candidatus Omnitrophota bacterium]
MYFKKLEIFGFKSFAEKTVLHFEPGITAVVGPNGCGKSNVFDAIRWVLGEQSVKQLRGGAMEDVIFNGTDTKLALGFAEVSVTFENSTRTLPVNHDEVVVTRRLFRSGESEYLINKEPVRLKDIVETFMGTGVGAEAYSLVQQGKVDLVVSAKPDDRRMIFDEASGITKYKAKKREAMNKLKEVDENLVRLNDIVVEVKRQISSLERQAHKAQRYKEEFEKLKTMEQIHATIQLDQSGKERADIQSALSAMKGNEETLQRELEDFRQVVERETFVLEELEQKVQEVRSHDLKLENQIELESRQIGFNQERLENLAQNEKRVAAQKEQLVDKCRVQQEKATELEGMIAAFGVEFGSATEELAQKRSALTAATALIQEYEQALRADAENIRQMTARLSAMKSEFTEIMKEREGYLARRRRLDMEQSKVAAERVAIEARLNGLSQGMHEIMARRQSIMDALGSEKAVLSATNDELSALNASIESLERKKLFLISQKEFIEKLHVQYQDMPDPVVTGRFFSPIPPDARHTGFIGKLQSVNQVSPERHEDLRKHLEGMDAPGLYEIICETKFVELDPLAIAAEIAVIDEKLKGLGEQRVEKLAIIAERSGTVERLNQDAHAEDRKLSVCEAQQSDIGVEAQKLLQELTAVDEEIREADAGLIRLNENDARIAGEIGVVEGDIRGCEDAIRGREESIALKRVEREEAAVALAQLESEINAMREREKSWQDNLAMFRASLNGYLDEMNRLAEEASSFGGRRDKLSEDIAQLEESVVRLRVEKGGLKETLVRYESEEKDVSQRINSLRAQTASMDKELANGRDSSHEMAMRTQQLDFQEQSVKERMLQRYSIDMAVIMAASTTESREVESGVEQPAVDIEALKQEIQTLSKRCDSFGGVNLMAIEEFDELKGRFQFLTKQQSDLLEAKTSLDQTIRKINKTTRELFIDTFTKVNEQFRDYFKLMFNGGEAHLVLMDPENALESGIEIVARPPGKKLQTISLLSGGEKTMTAIALIFAVFRVNPSPFCVLDEIDAALDEANVDRFSSVLKEFAKISQFIVITHNKKTMQHANVMYGVTMQQRGISKVVSVKFTGDKQETTSTPSAAIEKPEEAPVEEMVGV